LKLPRDLSGQELARLLERLGYEITRQTGSHIPLTKLGDTAHHITIPDHSTLKVGTIDAIFKDVAGHLRIGKDELRMMLWGGQG
jgi:predicted RNA binding protein YcfA (HicA-like mRNA interferase family)